MDKKNLIYRIVSSTLLIPPIIFAIIMLVEAVYYDVNNSYIFNMIVDAVVAAFALFQIILILLSIGKDLQVGLIAFNRFNSINKAALVIVNIFAAIGISIFITGCYLYYGSGTDVLDTIASASILASIGLLLICETFIYNLYVLMFRPRKFDIKSLS